MVTILFLIAITVAVATAMDHHQNHFGVVHSSRGNSWRAIEQEAKRQEQEAKERQRRKNRKREKLSSPPKKKKTIEEAIESAKKLPKVILDDEPLSEEASKEESLDPLEDIIMQDDDDDEEEEEEDPFVVPDSGIQIIQSADKDIPYCNNDSKEDSRNKSITQKRKKRKKHSKPSNHHHHQEEEEPHSAPTASPEQDSSFLGPTATIPAPTTTTTTTSQDLSPPPQPTSRSLIVGQTLLNKFVIAEQIRVGSTKSELYKCYHTSDFEREYPLAMKLSKNIEQIQLEHRIHLDLAQRLRSQRQQPDRSELLFVKVFDDFIDASTEPTNGQAGFVMECGIENLRGYIWRHGPYQGNELRDAMRAVIRIVNTLHQLGSVWTEVKAENLLVFQNDNNNNIIIKAIDLESVAAHGEYLRCYTAESYPPEFPPESLYRALPKIPLEYSFDCWGLGLVLFEMATGEPLFTLQRTYDVDYIQQRLQHPQGIIDEAKQKMMEHGVEEEAKNIILQCLVEDPTKRSSCEDLLKQNYFQSV
eukprot:scaffold8755_cov145-Cylindrotheca_fusiformis.AAC.1